MEEFTTNVKEEHVVSNTGLHAGPDRGLLHAEH
jgi:hypothetical protein